MALADLAPGQHVDQVRNHWWWRPGWRVGRRFYALHITFEDQPELHRLAGAYRTALADLPTVTLVPDRWLHLTMQGLGFTDEIPRATVEQVSSRVGAALAQIPTVTAQFAQPVVADEAIAIPAEPPQPIQRLRTAVREAIGHVLGYDQAPYRFRPHISVAYIATDGPAKPYLEALDQVAPEPAAATIDHISLIEMHRDQHMYEWTTLATHRLQETVDQ